MMTAFFAWSWILSGTSSHEKLETGYAVLPAGSLMDTRKSSGMLTAAAAAAATMFANSALTNTPEEQASHPTREQSGPCLSDKSAPSCPNPSYQIQAMRHHA